MKRGVIFVIRSKFLILKLMIAKSAICSKLNKKDFVKKFTKDPKNISWPKEMSIVKKLWKIFPEENFWNSLNLNFKLNSLCWFLSDDGRKFLNQEYKKFNLDLPENKKFEIENNNVAFDTKKDYDLDTVLNLREFLNLWQKKTL
jgi:hypothetical protein